MKWIDKMVERITRKETALNDRFCVNRHTVVCQSYHSDIQPYADLHKSGIRLYVRVVRLIMFL